LLWHKQTAAQAGHELYRNLSNLQQYTAKAKRLGRGGSTWIFYMMRVLPLYCLAHHKLQCAVTFRRTMGWKASAAAGDAVALVASRYK